MLGHFFCLDPVRAAVHECYVAAVAVTGFGYPPLPIVAVGQMRGIPDIELASAD